MNLGFMQTWPKHMGEWAGQPTYFIEKIHRGMKTLQPRLRVSEAAEFYAAHIKKFGKGWDASMEMLAPKLHTMREDPHDRWHAGKLIHFAINNQRKNYFRFAPVMECVSTQKVEIKEWLMCSSDQCYQTKNERIWTIDVDGIRLKATQIEELAINDGFESMEQFFTWFNKPATYKLIHWTALKY